MRYDDGFVAYLNGTEVLRRNAPATLGWNSSATSAHRAGTLAEDFEGSSANYALSCYSRASPRLACMCADSNSTGNFLRLLYDGVNAAANAIAFDRTAAGLFQSITADFDFRITSAVHNPGDAFAFMLIPTALYGTNGAGLNIAGQAEREAGLCRRVWHRFQRLPAFPGERCLGPLGWRPGGGSDGAHLDN